MIELVLKIINALILLIDIYDRAFSLNDGRTESTIGHL